MSAAMEGARPTVTEQERAEARAHIELLWRQRANPVPRLQEVQSQLQELLLRELSEHNNIQRIWDDLQGATEDVALFAEGNSRRQNNLIST